MRARTRKSKDDEFKSKGRKNRAKTPRTVHRGKYFYCERAGHVKSDCQQRAEDMRKAMAAGRPFVDKSEKVSAMQTTDETPPVASVTLAPDFDGYLFATTMDSCWNETLHPLTRPPTAQARRRANATPMSHGLSVLLLIVCCRWLPA